MEKQLVAVILISTILGALAGFVMTYVVLQPQIQSLQQTQSKTWHQILYLNQTIDQGIYETEKFQVKGNWIKIEWLDIFDYGLEITIMHSNGTRYTIKGIFPPSAHVYQGDWIFHEFLAGSFTFDVSIIPGEYYLIIGEHLFVDKVSVAVWDYY